MSKAETKIVKFKKSMKGCLRDETLVQNVVKDVREQLGEKKLEHYKHDVQMLIDICNCIEKNYSNKKKKKKNGTNKKDIVLKIFAELFQDIDLNDVDTSIETVLNNKLIKNYNLISRAYRFVSHFFLED